MNSSASTRVLLGCLVLLASSGRALAGECAPVSSVPQQLEGGAYCLAFDVGVQGLTAFTLGSDTTLDCRGHKIWDIGGASTPSAIRASGNNVVVKNCIIEGFRDPLIVSYATGYVIEDNLLVADSATTHSIYVVASDNGRVVGNRLINNQPFGGHYWGIYVNSGTVDILRNVVSGAIAEPGSGASVYGISSYSNNGGLVAGNIVRNLIPDGLQAISINLQYGRSVLRDNLLLNPGIGDIGIFCYSGEYVVERGFELGFATPRQGGC